MVAADQHAGYGSSVDQYCKNASLVWDRFHLVQNFNDLVNDERKSEAERVKGREHYGILLTGKNKWIFLMKSTSHSKSETAHINEVMLLNDKSAKLEIIKELFHQMFNCTNKDDAELMLYEVYQWACNIQAWPIANYFLSLREAKQFWNYFRHRYTISVVEGINRGIKTLKWVAYGYKDMGLLRTQNYAQVWLSQS